MNIREKLEQLSKYDLQMEILQMELQLQKRQVNQMEISVEFCADMPRVISGIEKRMIELRQRRSLIKNAIDKISGVNSRIALELYYIFDLPLRKVAKKMSYSERRVEQYIEEGLNELETIFESLK